MAPKTRSAGDVAVDVEQLRAVEARRPKSEASAPFVYRPGMPTDPRSLTVLQRSAGNAAVATLLRNRPTRPRPRPRPRPTTAPAEDHAMSEGVGETGLLDQSVMIGEAGNARPPAPKHDDGAGQAAQAAVQSVASGERTAILMDAALSNKHLDEELVQSKARVAGEVGAAKMLASAELVKASVTTQAFLNQKHGDVMKATSEAEKAATAEAAAMTKQAEAQAGATAGQFMGTVSGISAGLQSRVGGFVGSITGAIANLSLPDLPGVSAIRAGITNLVRGAASGVTNGISAVQGLIGRLVTSGLAAVKSLLGSAKGVVTNIIQRVGTAVRNAATSVGRALTTIAGKVASAFNNLLRNVVFPALDKVRDTITGHLVAGHRNAKAAVKANTDFHLAALDKVAKTAPGIGAQAAAGAGAGGEDPVATFRAIGQRSREGNAVVVDLFGGRIGSVLAGIKSIAMHGVSQVVQKISGVASHIVATIGAKVGEALGAVRQIAGAVSGFLGSVLGSIRTALSGAIDWVKRTATAPVDALVNFGSQTANAARNFIGTAISNVLHGNFSLPSLGAGTFRPNAANDTAGPVPASAVQASFSTSAGSVLSIIGIVALALVGLVMLPFILGPAIALALAAAAAAVVFGPLLLVIALVVYGIYKLVKWIATPSKLEVTHTTNLDAPDGSPKTRSVVGVGERIVLKASKLSSWKASGGEPTSAAPKGQLAWQAPRFAGNAEVTAEVVDKSSSEKVSFTVVEPASITAKKEKEKSFPTGEQGAGMVLNFVYGPMNVSFGGVEAREKSGGPSGVDGYYKREGMPHNHDATSTFFSIAANNQLAGEVRDKATQEGMPSPWEHGSFHWDIPNEFRADEDAPPKVFTTTKQEFVMLDDTGTTTITKQGASVTRKP